MSSGNQIMIDFLLCTPHMTPETGQRTNAGKVFFFFEIGKIGRLQPYRLKFASSLPFYIYIRFLYTERKKKVNILYSVISPKIIIL